MASPYHNTRARRIFIRVGVTLAAADRISRHHIRLDKLSPTKIAAYKRRQHQRLCSSYEQRLQRDGLLVADSLLLSRALSCVTFVVLSRMTGPQTWIIMNTAERYFASIIADSTLIQSDTTMFAGLRGKRSNECKRLLKMFCKNT